VGYCELLGLEKGYLLTTTKIIDDLKFSETRRLRYHATNLNMATIKKKSTKLKIQRR